MKLIYKCGYFAGASFLTVQNFFTLIRRLIKNGVHGFLLRCRGFIGNLFQSLLIGFAHGIGNEDLEEKVKNTSVDDILTTLIVTMTVCSVSLLFWGAIWEIGHASWLPPMDEQTRRSRIYSLPNPNEELDARLDAMKAEFDKQKGK